MKREDVERTIDELNPVPRAIVLLILYTGARPGEICGIRTDEITMDGPNGTWVFRPGKHKTLHHGKRRFVVFGTKGQSVLKECWPKHGPMLFPSANVPGPYRPSSLRQAVHHACKRAGVKPWAPYSLRHLRLTELAVDKGLEAAAAVAGHGELSTTKIYQHEPDILQLNRAV